MIEFKLTAAQRGYKQAGKKLGPRDAANYQFGKSNKERRRHNAAELKHNQESEREYLASIGCKPSALEARLERFAKALSTRRRKQVERMFEDSISSDHKDLMIRAACQCLGNAQWRYFDALDNMHCAELARIADDNLLSWARG